MDVRAIMEALQDARVVSSMELALRDVMIRRRFAALRSGSDAAGLRVWEAVAQLAEEFCLSEERIRSIVYRKEGGIRAGKWRWSSGD